LSSCPHTPSSAHAVSRVTAAIIDSEVRALNSCEAWLASPMWD